MADYKGIYYKDNKEDKQIFYEGGAHFKYNKLYKILAKLALNQKMRIKREKLIESRERKLNERYKRLNKSVEERNINKVSFIKCKY